MDSSKFEAIRLVQAVEKYPVLYDNNVQRYSGRIGQKDAWNRVALETKNNPSSCKEKWQSIRSKLIRYIKSNSKQNFYLLEHLQFLIPFLKFRTNETVNYLVNESSPEVNSTGVNPDVLSYAERKHIREVESEESDGEKIVNKKSSKSKKKHQELSIFDDEEDDADIFFFKSVWADVKKMNRTQKLQFRISVLNSMEKILSSSEPSAVCSSSKRKSSS